MGSTTRCAATIPTESDPRTAADEDRGEAPGIAGASGRDLLDLEVLRAVLRRRGIGQVEAGGRSEAVEADLLETLAEKRLPVPEVEVGAMEAARPVRLHGLLV